ncbi:MAG: class I SAM-dependent methyltransferase, partial [Bacteroidota bacterium]
TPDLLCPRCGSLPRKRLLWRYLVSEMAIEQQSWRVLHFSPSRQLEKRLRALPALTYISTDYENPNADRQYDITNIGEEDGAYDLIICYHVMEHIPDDRQAMRELYRLLRPGGTALIQTPHREAPTYEDPAITAPEDRLKAFGQEDHVRYYGREDLTARLTATGFAVDENRYASGMDAATIERLGLNVEEIIFVCRK